MIRAQIYYYTGFELIAQGIFPRKSVTDVASIRYREKYESREDAKFLVLIGYSALMTIRKKFPKVISLHRVVMIISVTLYDFMNSIEEQ